MIYLLLLIILLRSYVPSYVYVWYLRFYLFVPSFVHTKVPSYHFFILYYDYHIILCLPVMTMIMMIPFICDFNWYLRTL